MGNRNRQISKMKTPRVDKKRRASTATPSESPTEEAEKKKVFVGCPVPEPIVCCTPKVPVEDDEGVDMICTNESCPLGKQKLHPQCFHELEESLVKRLRTQGSARDWTDAQRRNNLWERKGLSLIGKFCRCRCGLGQVRFDKDAAFEKEKAMKREAKKEKKKKALPTLHFSTHTDDVRKLKTLDFSKSARNHYHDSNVSFAPSTPNDSHNLGESNGQYRNFDFKFTADTSMNDLCDSQSTTDVIPAPLPPQQTRSYASLIKEKQSDEVANQDSGLGQENRSSSMEVVDCIKMESVESGINEPNSEEVDMNNYSLISPIPTCHENSHEEVGSSRKKFWHRDEESPNLPTISTSNEYPLTSTPRSKKTNRYVAPHFRRRDRQSSTSTTVTIRNENWSDDEPKCSIVFKKRNNEKNGEKKEDNVRELENMMRKLEVSEKQPPKKGELIYGWTPFFGFDFNLGERIMYLP